MSRAQILAWWTLVSIFAIGLASGLIVAGIQEAQDVVIVSFVAYAVVGALVTRRRSENAVGWIFLGVGAFTGLAAAAAALVEGVDPGEQALTLGQTIGAWIENWFWYPTLMLATTFTVLLFPEGLPSRRWRAVLWSATLSTVLATLYGMLEPTLLVDESGQRIDNPVSPWGGAGSQPSALWELPMFFGLLCGLAAVVSIVLRFRRARGVERAQLRWFALAVSVVAISIGISATLESQPEPLTGQSAAVPVMDAVLALSLGLIPIACGIAITRHGLYEVDRIVSRTVSYAIVSGVVLATYALVVTSVSRLLPESNTLAVAGATLAAAAMVRPVLGRVQNRVDRSFNRARFDAAREVDAFAGRLRNSVDTTETLSDLQATVERTLAPATVGVWTGGSSS